MLEIGNGQIRTPVVSIHSGWNRDRRWLCGSTDSLGTLVSQLTLTEYMETQRNHCKQCFSVGLDPELIALPKLRERRVPSLKRRRFQGGLGLKSPLFQAQH